MSEQKYTDDDLKRVAGIKDDLFRDELKIIGESLTSLQEQMSQVPKRDEFNELKPDMKAVKAAVRENSRLLQDYERRITHLEANA